MVFTPWLIFCFIMIWTNSNSNLTSFNNFCYLEIDSYEGDFTKEFLKFFEGKRLNFKGKKLKKKRKNNSIGLRILRKEMVYLKG